ncbi:MAG TPA: hypothetical protein VJ436_11600, partial [Anaerolineales bacterium]|nr:hypothetical protein [Anaerolineales bacterium]
FSATELDPAWSWVDEDPTHWSLIDRPGYLRITTQQEIKNKLVRRAPMTTYAIRTHLLFTPVENFQLAGLSVFLDTDNHLTFSRAYCNIPPPTCVGNGIYFDHIENGAVVGSNFATATDVTGEVYLRIVRIRVNYTASFSTNGTEWVEVGTHVVGFEPRQVGLLAFNSGQPVSEIPADFDYFVLVFEYFKIYLPVID